MFTVDQWDSNCGCHGCLDTPKIQVRVSDTHTPTILVYLVTSKLHRWCIQVIPLLLETRDTDIQAVFELFIYFWPIFRFRRHQKQWHAGLWLQGVDLRKPKGVKRKEGWEGEWTPQLVESGCAPAIDQWHGQKLRRWGTASPLAFSSLSL